MLLGVRIIPVYAYKKQKIKTKEESKTGCNDISAKGGGMPVLYTDKYRFIIWR